MKRDMVRALLPNQRAAIHRTHEQHNDGILRIVSGETKSVVSKDSMILRAVLSSETVDRYGDILRATAFNTPKNHTNYFKANPVLLWAHNRDSSVPTRPIGKVLNPAFNGTDMNGLRAFEGDVAFDETYDFAQEVWKGYEGGYLKAFSVGFRPITVKQESEECDGYEFLEVDLLENSCVPIPANPAALRKAFTDGAMSEKFLERSFFGMRDEIIVRNADIFVPMSWDYRSSLNAMAQLAGEIRSGELSITKNFSTPVKVKTEYVCEACAEKSMITDTDFSEKDYQGVTYRNVECPHCKAMTEECLAAMDLLSSIETEVIS